MPTTNTSAIYSWLAGAVLLGIAALHFSGCTVGPNYQKPVTPDLPGAFVDPGPWKLAAPKDTVPKGAWWQVFRDPLLSELEMRAVAASPTIRAAVARRDQARAIAGVTRGDYLPSLGLDPSASRARFSGSRQVQTPSTRDAYTANTFNLPLDLSYEIDLWGRVRRANESASALAEASDAAYQSVLLGVEVEVAQNYFFLRSLIAEHQILDRSIQTRRDALDLVRIRYSGGASGELDVFRGETELANAENDALTLDQRREALQHALAVLCGQLPEGFTVAENALPLSRPPELPLGLPSELLERRPDIAQAERALAASNAQIGLAKAAFFPSLRLIGSAGYNSSELDSLFTWDSRQWSLGPSITLPIFQGGRNRANYQRAQAAYDESVANYRGRVLVAFQEVEDGLGNLRHLNQQVSVIARAVTSSRQAEALSTVRYKAGLVSYLEVIDAERTALQNERLATQLNAQNFVATVQLVRALGGGW